MIGRILGHVSHKWAELPLQKKGLLVEPIPLTALLLAAIAWAQIALTVGHGSGFLAVLLLSAGIALRLQRLRRRGNLLRSTARDITGREHAEKRVRESEQLFRTIFEQSPIGIALIGLDYRLLKVNRALCSMLGYSEQELIGSEMLCIIDPGDRQRALQQFRTQFSFGLAPHRSQRRCVRKDGQVIWVNVIRSVVRDQEGKVLYAVALFENISEGKKSEKQLLAALTEKDILLREVHHRVKNNLQVISSLLHLQAGSINDPAALEIFKESQNRVQAMALVHEQLHRCENLSKINLGSYLKSLAAGLFCSYGVDSATVALHMSVDEVFLDIDTAIPCGLIVHELVANCLRHAFPDGRKGEVGITLESLPDARLSLMVTDNGIGFPEQKLPEVGKSLGLRLVNILVAQIEGAVEWSTCRGTRFRVRFKEPIRKEDN